MNDIVLEASVVNVEPQAEVLVDAVSDAEAVALDSVVRLENHEYVLSSGGMYGGGALIGSIPAWILEAVNQRLTTGDGNLTSLVNDLQIAMDALETGVTQSISNLEAKHLSQSGLITGLRSDVDGNNSTIMNVLATKVTASESSALALNAIQSKFGDDVDSYIGNIASTYVDSNSAIAQEVDMLQASLNGVSASITDISSITIETVQNPLWVDDGNGTDPDINDEPRWIDQAKAKKQLEVNADGVITGLLLESGQTSSIIMQADEFKLVATGQAVASRNPFTVDAVTGEITLNGKVSFNSVTDAPDLVAENTNINVSTNLIPNAGWGVGGHGDYQFVGTPTYYRIVGAGTVSEDTLLLNVGDEVYTPYIEDMGLSYKLSYSFKGAKIGSFITAIGTTPTTASIIPGGVTVDPAKWYNVQVAVLPNGTAGGNLFGFIQESATLNIVSVISDIVLGTGIEKFLMGFTVTADTYISRVGIEVITANTLSSVPVTAGNMNTVLASTNTVIDGGRITTGYISANRIAANSITTSKLSTNIALIDGSAYSAGFPYPSGAITGAPTGFRLSSSATGTESDPTIYGAYIKGSYIKGSVVDADSIISGSLTDSSFDSGNFTSGTGTLIVMNGYNFYIQMSNMLENTNGTCTLITVEVSSIDSKNASFIISVDDVTVDVLNVNSTTKYDRFFTVVQSGNQNIKVISTTPASSNSTYSLKMSIVRFKK